MKNLHYGHCLIGVAVAVALLVAFGVSAGTLGIVAVASACPIMMVVMMRTMMSDRPAAPQSDDRPVDDTQQV